MFCEALRLYITRFVFQRKRNMRIYFTLFTFVLYFLLQTVLCFSQSDLPCNAPILIVDPDSCIFISGTTVGATCQNNAANGGTPNCASPGSPDVWYAFIVPPSGAVSITTTPGTITDGGMAVYSGPCSNPQFIECDDDDANGNMPVVDRTDFNPGDTIFVRFWRGWNPGTGTFNLCIIESHSDCRAATEICTEGHAYHAPENAYGKGNRTELMGQSAQCGSPEFQSHWVKFRILTGGVLSFKIFPDSIGPNIYPDYDWILFQSNNPNFCLTYDSINAVPVCCNGSSSQGPYGSTGLDASGVSCSVQPGPGNPFSPLLNVLSGDVYYMLINNFSTTSSDFDLDFSGTTATFYCNFPTEAHNLISSNEFFATIASNPVKGVTLLTFYSAKIPDELELELFNSLGQSVLKKDIFKTNTEIDCTSLQSEVYFYRLYNDKRLFQSGKLSVLNY